jgi:HEAT repeat protein
MGLQALGPGATNAVPRLIEILEQGASESSIDYTARTLAVIGPEAKAAVPSLLRAATDSNLSNHSYALWALGMIHANPDEVVPVLITALGNPSGQDQLFAVIALGKFKGDAKSAVPALEKVLESLKPTPASAAATQTFISQIEIRIEARKALQQIDPESYSRFATNAGQAQSNRLDLFSPPKTPF